MAVVYLIGKLMTESWIPFVKVANRLGDILIDQAPKVANGAWKNIEFIVSKGLPQYIEANNARCEFIRTLLNRDKPVPIDAAFVEPNFRIDEEVLSAGKLLERIYQGPQRTIVTGPAGGGKSVFLKHSFRRVIEHGYTYYPIFFELRELNFDKVEEFDLEKSLFDSIEVVCEGFLHSQFVFGLKRGAFYLLLDGFDEVSQNLRDSLQEQLCRMSRKYPLVPIIMTSRPGDGFVSWEGFTEAHLEPFSKEQASEFIAKIDFGKARKVEFLEALNSTLYERHQSFLSNPLLASMMLLTYDEYGDIPAKRHVFFEKCFQVLLREHDVSKGRYRRKFYTGLDYQEMEELFKFFCTYSYLERQFSFNNSTMKSYIGDAIEAVEVKVDVSDVVRDFCESISIMQRDGSHFEFAHRSFQEYFFARFVVEDREHSLAEKIGELPSVWLFDDTVDMISDMNMGYFCRGFLLPEAKRLLSELSDVDVLKRPSSVLIKFFNKVADGSKTGQAHYYIELNGERKTPQIRNHFILRHLLKRAERLDDDFVDFDFPKLSDSQKNMLAERGNYGFRVHHTNDKYLLELGCHEYAQWLRENIASFVVDLERSSVAKKSKLANRMRARAKG